MYYDMKTCIACGENKDDHEFSMVKRKNGYKRQGRCADCRRAYGRQHYKENKKLYVDRNHRQKQRQRDKLEQMKNVPCADCGNRFHTWVMEFDHREGEVKLGNVSRLFLVARLAESKLLEEVNKCDIVCSNCHRMRTYRRIMKKKDPGCTRDSRDFDMKFE